MKGSVNAKILQFSSSTDLLPVSLNFAGGASGELGRAAGALSAAEHCRCLPPQPHRQRPPCPQPGPR